MSNNWGFVIAGYAITTLTLTGYFAWIWQRSRRLRRSIEDENGE